MSEIHSLEAAVEKIWEEFRFLDWYQQIKSLTAHVDSMRTKMGEKPETSGWHVTSMGCDCPACVRAFQNLPWSKS